MKQKWHEIRIALENMPDFLFSIVVNEPVLTTLENDFCLLVVELNGKFFLILLNMLSESTEWVAVHKFRCSVKSYRGLFN